MKAILTQPKTYVVCAYSLIFLGIITAYFEWVSPIVGLVLFMLGPLLSLVGVVTLVISLFRRNFMQQKKYIMPLMVPLLIIVWGLYLRSQFPVINDISTRPDRPIPFPAGVKNADGEVVKNSYSSAQIEAIQKFYPDLKPLNSNFPAFRTYEELRILLDQIPSVKILHEDQKKFELQFTQRSKIFHFVDDVAVKILDSGEEKSIVHWRSRSRIGKTDFGANAARIESMNRLFSERLQSQSP